MNKLSITIKLDGDTWFAHRDDFINLQESEAGFGLTPQKALKELLYSEKIGGVKRG